ncbi:MAG: ribbon-helix-helix protein, CopG family [Clostridia bacterium]|nr:ribbon-helix-helix protein, CopG family [Clostridia bacterium]
MKNQKEIKITKKTTKKGDDGYKIVSVRMKDETIDALDSIANTTNRSRNEVINILLDSALEIVTIDDSEKE